MQHLTAKEIAERAEVPKRVAQGWIQRGLFPNARKETFAPFGEIWLVPESDLESFERPARGRPRGTAPTE